MDRGLTSWQSPQPTAAWVKRALADEVSGDCLPFCDIL
jgi:hypothetical protein